jgi:hypothetical protein
MERKKKSDPAWQTLQAEKQAKREELKKQREDWLKKLAEKQAAGGEEHQWKGRHPFKKRHGGQGYGGFEKHWGEHPGGHHGRHPGGPKQPE